MPRRAHQIRLRHFSVVCLLGAALSAVSLFAAADPVFREDCGSDPQERGWTIEGDPHGARTEAIWTPPTASEGRKSTLSVCNGMWYSPRFAVEPDRYYELRFTSTAPESGMWVADFYNPFGRKTDADHYSGFDPGTDQANRFCFRTRPDTPWVRLGFRSCSVKPIWVSDITVQAIERLDVAKWADAVYATVPPVSFTPPWKRHRHIPHTMSALRRGVPVTIVLLGDSIVNDTGNSALDVLLERRYPNASVRLINSVRGHTGCEYYRQANRVQEYVLRHEPDLVIIGGISNGGNGEAVRVVIRQIREQCEAEILVLSGAVGRIDPRAMSDWDAAVERLPRNSYRSRLQRIAEAEGVEFFDLEGAWGSYILACGKPYDFFLRDPLHANERGRQVLARILDAWFASGT